MTTQSSIDALKRQIQELESAQKSCFHTWGETIYDPEKTMQGYGSKFVGRGSDHWTEYEGYEEVYKPRWKRCCQKCGIAQYTNKQETVQVISRPTFS